MNPGHPPMQPRRAFTLVEMLTVVVIMGSLALLAMPRFEGLKERGNVSAARDAIEAAIVTARSTAIQKGRPAQLRIINNGAIVTVPAPDGSQLTVVPHQALDSLYGVTVSATNTTVTFDVRGFMIPRLTGTGIFRVQGPTRSDSVCITVAGQLMPKGCAL